MPVDVHDDEHAHENHGVAASRRCDLMGPEYQHEKPIKNILLYPFLYPVSSMDMRVLVTGSSGHLGEALVRTLREINYEVIGLDVVDSPFTTCVGSITDRSQVRRCMRGCERSFI
jgi:hypothetical protein